MNFGDTFPMAIGVAISPIPIIAVILMLFSPKAKSNGLAFLLGWAGALLLTGSIALFLASAGKISEGGDPSTVASTIKLIFGFLFLLLAYRNWKSRPKEGEQAEMPKWMAGIDSFTSGKSLSIAALLAGVNPKNLGLTFAAAMVIFEAEGADGQIWLSLILYVLIASLTVAIPVLYFIFAGESAQKTLTGWKSWLLYNNNAVMIILFLVLGLKLIGDALDVLLG